MAIKSDTYFWAECDRCDERICGEFDNGGYMLEETEKGAREQVEYYDGRIEADGTFTCCSCIDNEPPEEANSDG